MVIMGKKYKKYKEKKRKGRSMWMKLSLFFSLKITRISHEYKVNIYIYVKLKKNKTVKGTKLTLKNKQNPYILSPSEFSRSVFNGNSGIARSQPNCPAKSSAKIQRSKIEHNF